MKYLIKIIIALVIFIIVLDCFSLSINKKITEALNFCTKKISNVKSHQDRLLKIFKKIGMNVFEIDDLIYVVDPKTKKFTRFERVPGLVSFKWYDLKNRMMTGNKWVAHNKMKKADIPQAKSLFFVRDIDNNHILEKTKANLKAPYVIKLTRGFGGDYVYLNLRKDKEILKVLKYLKTRSEKEGKQIIIQEHFKSKNEYRITMYGNKIVSIFQKKKAYIIGNGSSNIKEIIDNVNQKNYSIEIKYNIPMPCLKLDPSIKINNKIVPKKGEKFYLTDKKNNSFGNIPTSVNINTVHKDNIELFKRVSQIFIDKYDHHILGIDYLIDDLSKSYKTHPSIVIEVNSSPGFLYFLTPWFKDIFNITEKQINESIKIANKNLINTLKYVQQYHNRKIEPEHIKIFNKKIKEL